MANGKKKSVLDGRIGKNWREGMDRNPSPTIMETIASKLGLSDTGDKKRDARRRVTGRAIRDTALRKEYGDDAMRGRSFMSNRDSRDGISRVRTRVPREMDDEVLMNAGGYMGGSSMSGRGTMAGELGRKGSMSVREAGEDMYELSKRRRGMQGGGGVASSSYNRKYNQKNK